jgi:hypothetical protein
MIVDEATEHETRGTWDSTEASRQTIKASVPTFYREVFELIVLLQGGGRFLFL